MTNGEKIRNMSDEELAKFLCENCHSCRDCIALLYCYDGNSDGFINWIQEYSEKLERQQMSEEEWNKCFSAMFGEWEE